MSPGEIEAAVGYIRRTKEIREVILSGGDPLTLTNDSLEGVLNLLRTIPHLEVIRIGTRAPVVLPWRIDRGLTAILEKYGPIWVNTHFNHPREVTAEAGEACLRLLKAGAPVNNQTVLLKGINDTAGTMTELCRALQRIRVRPYYLFRCDPVRGAGHFRTPLSTGMGIIGEMRESVGGLCLPTFVVDLPGERGKVPIQPDCPIFPGENPFV
jgi:lysine 2,3-aminomutase